MNPIRAFATTTLALAMLLGGAAGCQKEEGPAERAGKQVDKAVDTVGKKVEEAGEKIQDAARDAKK